MIGYILALLPLYIFIYLPVSQLLFPSSSPSESPRSSSSSDTYQHTFNASFIAPEDPNLICPTHYYNAHILSREPLVFYLENWLSEEEILHLLETSADQFETSHVSTGADKFIDPTIRLSEVAVLPRSQTVKCIEARARALQGWGRPDPSSSQLGWSFFGGATYDAPLQNSQEQDNPHAQDTSLAHGGLQHGGGKAEGGKEEGEGSEEGLMLERLKIQRYGPGGHYTHHYDWQGAGRVDRVSSFMVFVDANCTGGGTGFPRLSRPRSRHWCQFIDCDAPEYVSGRQGVIFKPVRGNAVFWENLRADGTGYVETWHAGLPVETGTKIGLNIWSWYRF